MGYKVLLPNETTTPAELDPKPVHDRQASFFHVESLSLSHPSIH